ncbi:uncharacterized protein TRIADDRAFT_61475 [Trichoplax adhaerens]|uniref:HDAg domain-containing protein n=1 Tax=Trichoplax adhaerens TaxID=10228 RepID=B3SB33_TRIAD|nr:hypothetical protein TRIADDRAFT_61475 [Trichoplax adhaerens]EDV20093.1 hypothetical protein TRIADDRAFT_61475 [Trichoplax adhaerens]|eukprot:XP_002117477.1 hypothetical protein TRIADDRAFT_61475 [Trichoplax adhaerens]
MSVYQSSLMWLQNRLSGSDNWCSKSAAMMLDREVLANIKDAFHTMEAQVKLRLILSLFHLSHAQIEEFSQELSEILQQAVVDRDQWTSTIARIMVTLYSPDYLDSLKNANQYLADFFTSVTEAAKKASDTMSPSLEQMPLEASYINSTVLNNLYGKLPNVTKHFTLKRKPKSAELRAMLIEKSITQSGQAKQERFNKIEPSTPLPTIGNRRPSAASSSANAGFIARNSTPTIAGRNLPTYNRGLRTPTNVRSTKLLEIEDQPRSASREAKRKKKQTEDNKDNPPAKVKKTEQPKSPTTPSNILNYASSIKLPVDEATGTSESTLYAKSRSAKKGTELDDTKDSAMTTNVASPTVTSPLTKLNEDEHKTEKHSVDKGDKTSTGKSSSKQSSTKKQSDKTPSNTKSSKGQNRSTKAQRKRDATSAVTTATSVKEPKALSPVTTAVTAAPTGSTTPTLSSVTSKIIATKDKVDNEESNDKTPTKASSESNKQFCMSRAQLVEFNNMFRQYGNRVSFEEKAQILQFIVGMRNNPNPSKGAIVEILLGIHDDKVVDENGKEEVVPCKSVFVMNYDTGEWRRETHRLP